MTTTACSSCSFLMGKQRITQHFRVSVVQILSTTMPLVYKRRSAINAANRWQSSMCLVPLEGSKPCLPLSVCSAGLLTYFKVCKWTEAKHRSGHGPFCRISVGKVHLTGYNSHSNWSIQICQNSSLGPLRMLIPLIESSKLVICNEWNQQGSSLVI